MLSKYLERGQYSDIGKEVFDRLKEIWDEDEFISCNMYLLDTEEKLQKLLDFLIESGMTDSDDVIPYVLKIKKGLV